MKTIVVIIAISFFNQITIAQKGHNRPKTLIGLSIGAFASRYFGDVYVEHIKKSGFGFSVSFGFGEYGKRVYDNKTKDIFGRTYDPSGEGRDYIKISNVGVQGKVTGIYQFCFNRFINLNVGILAGGVIYRQKLTEVDHDIYYDTSFKPDTVSANKVNVNFCFGFEVLSIWNISKKWGLSFGFTLPFYVLNPNKFGISDDFDPPLLGTEPFFSLGLRYKFK
jgi:hypothetical protein